MNRFQHMMRTTQHTKSVEQIMTRTNHHFFNSKSPHMKPSPQGENITKYLRKFEIDRQNLNLAKRIMQCESQHSKERYMKEWQDVKRFLRVRSNFKRTLHAKEPKIYKFEPILGKGKLQINFQIKDIQMYNTYLSKRNLYKFAFVLGNNQIQPDKKLITMDFMKNYCTSFYAPLFLKKKPIIGKIFNIYQNNYYETGRYQVDLAQPGIHESDILNKFGKIIGKVKYQLAVQGGRSKLHKKSVIVKQNFPFLSSAQGHTEKVKFCSQSQV